MDKIATKRAKTGRDIAIIAILLIINTFADWILFRSFDTISVSLSSAGIGFGSFILLFPMGTLVALFVFVYYFVKYGRADELKPQFTSARIARWVERAISLPLLAFGILGVLSIYASLSTPCATFSTCTWTRESIETVIIMNISLVIGGILFVDSWIRNRGLTVS